MQPFFSSGKGSFWFESNTGMWMHLGINCLSVFAIILWAGIHSFIIFGTLQYFGMLRIDLDTELQGSDITKHGEDAYQVNDWMRPNSDISTQTMNYEESSTRLDVFPKCPGKGILRCFNHSSSKMSEIWLSWITFKQFWKVAKYEILNFVPF